MEGQLDKKGNISPAELSPNEPDLQRFGNKCQITSTLGGYNVYAVDFKYLNEAIRPLLEENHEVVKIELQRKNQHSELVMKWFIYCASLEECLKKATKIQLGLEGLENFKEHFQAQLMMKQEEISKEMQTLNRKISKRLRSTKRWRKALAIISSVVSMVGPFMGMATAMVAPPIVTSIEQANTVLLGYILRWFDSFWKGKENSLKRKEKVIKSMEQNYARVQELNTVLDQIYKTGIEFESFFRNADMEEEDKMTNLGGFLKKIEDLCKQADMCSSYIGNARKGVLRSIIEDPAK